MEDFDTALKLWADKAVAYCHEIAVDVDKEMDLTFYAFQSPPKFQPSVLVLGLNPGGYPFTYADQYNNPIWGLDKSLRMTADVFIRSNPCKESYTTFKLWRNLTNMFASSEMEDVLVDHVYMNYIYFNTGKFNDLYKRKFGSAAIAGCKVLSIDLIKNVIQPKNILCLGTSDCFDRMPVQDVRLLLKGKKRLLLKGCISGIPTFGIPHPSGSFTSNQDVLQIGKILKEELLSRNA